MPDFILDTDTMSRFRLGNPPIIDRLLRTPPEQVAITVITVEEQLNGWYAQSLWLNIGKMDLRIGAIALTHGATVVTSNYRDFSRIPNLAIEDWA